MTKNEKNLNEILPCNYLQETGHKFNKHTKIIIIDKLININSTKDILRQLLRDYKHLISRQTRRRRVQ